jgi:hypothetical protein
MIKNDLEEQNKSKKLIKYRFPLWLTIFFLLLLSIPTFTFIGQLLVAKVLGIFCLILVIISLRIWLRISRVNSEKVDRVVLNKNQLFELERNYSFLRNLNNSERQVIVNRTGLILAEIKFISFNNEEFSNDEIIEFAFNVSISQLDNEYKNLCGSEIIISKGKKHNYLCLADLPSKSMVKNFQEYKMQLQHSQFLKNFNELISQT